MDVSVTACELASMMNIDINRVFVSLHVFMWGSNKDPNKLDPYVSND